MCFYYLLSAYRMFSTVLARVWPKGFFSNIHLHQPGWTEDWMQRELKYGLELCSFRYMLLRSQATIWTNHCILIRLPGDDKFPCVEIFLLGILADEEWFLFSSSLLLLKTKLVTLEQEAAQLPRDKHKRLHPILLEQTAGTVYCQENHRMVWRLGNKYKQGVDFEGFCSW